MIDRQEAHARLDTLLDALDTARGANDPKTQMTRESEAVGVFAAFSKALVGDLHARRRGRDAHRVRPDIDKGWTTDKLTTAGHDEWSLAELKQLNREERKVLRHALATSALDAEAAGIFQPGVGVAFAAAMRAANVGAPEFGKWLWPSSTPGKRTSFGTRERRLLTVGVVAYEAAYTGNPEEKVWNDRRRALNRRSLRYGSQMVGA